MRTDQEALLHAYLSEYEKIQANTVSSGKKKVASSAATGAQNMDRMGRVSIPKSYDSVPALVNMAVQQNKAELAEAERQRKAAERAAAKAAKEAAQQEEKDAAAKAAAERWAQLQQKAGGNTKAEPSGKKKSKFKEDEGNKTAAAQANRRGKNTGNWLEVLGQSMIEAAPQALNAALPGGNIASMMGMRPEAPSVEIPQRSLAEQMALYTQQAAQVQELERQLSEIKDMRFASSLGNPASQSVFTPAGMTSLALTMRGLTDATQQEDITQRQEAIKADYDTAQKRLEQYDAELHAMVAELAPETQYDVWVSPNYKLSSQEQARANEFFKEAVEQTPGILWEEYAQQYPASAKLILEGTTKWQPKYMGYDGAEIAAAYAEMSDEEKAQAQKLNFVRKKISDPAAFANSAMNAAPFYTEFAERAQQANAEEKGFERPEELNAQQLLGAQRQQSPIAGTAGMLAGTMAEYGTGSRLMKAIPGVGKALGNAGEAIAGTDAAQAFAKIPVLGRLATADALAGMMGDTILDMGFDTIPSLARDVGQYQKQQERIGELDNPEQQAKLAQLGLTRDEAVRLLEDQTGELLTPGKIAGNAIGNLGANLAFNAAGELIPELWRTARDSLGPKPNLEVDHIPALEGAIGDASRQVDEIPNLRMETSGEGVASGGLTALNGAGGNSEIQALTEAFKNGTLTSKQIETLKPGGANRAAFEEVTGLQLPATSSETRRMLRAGPQVDLSVEKSLKELDIQTASWDEILNSPEIRQAREQAKFETPTIAIATPERQALRQQIADELLELGSFSGKDAAGNELFSGPVRQERRADIVIGPPAAGKSSVLANPLSQQYGSRIIDSDMAKAKLPEFNGGIGAAQVHEESARITENIMLQQAMDRGDNIVIPWVGKSPEKLRDALSSLHDAGYTVHLSLNELDPEKAARRAIERFQNIGRFVDPEYVLSVGWKPSEAYDILKTEGGFDSYAKYSNDVELGQPARLIERIGKTESSEVQDGGVGGHGGELLPDRNAGAENQNSTQPAEVGSQGNPAAFSVPETGAGPNIPAGMKERGFAQSLRTQSDLPDEVKQAFVDQPEVYRQLSNAETLAKADGIIAQGLDRARAEYASLLRAKDPAAIPLGKQIADGLIAQGNRDEAVVLLREMSEKLTQSGQFSQAAAITLMKNDPMTALQYVQKDIDKMNREGAKKFGRKWKDFVLTEGEVAAFGAAPAGDEAALKGLFEQVGARIAREYPVTTWEKLVEASHVAMLLNPRTQTRNAFANALILPEQWFSRKLSAAGQNVLSWFKKDYQPNQALRVSRESKDLAAQAYDTIKARIGETASGKWENTALKGRADKEVFKTHGEQNFVSRIPMLGDTFDWMGRNLGRASEKLTGENVFKALSDEKSVAENLRQFTYGLLELGDAPFVKRNFVNRMASFIEARGYKSLQEVPPEAYEVAWQEALKATFKDDNAISNAIVSLKRTTGPFGEMAMPFTKTPANITARALDYSPYGLVRGAIRWGKKGGDPSAYIDEISKGLTGTGLILLGAQLYKSGVVTGPASENKRQAAFDKQQGKLPYSIKIGDNYYTYDWAQPAATGLVLGSTLAAQWERDGGIDAQSIAEIVKNSGVTFVDTLLEQSTLQNVADLFGGYSSFGENLFNETAETPQRLLPSLMGATARTVDPVQRQTFSSGDVLKTQWDTFQGKIPFLSRNLPAAYDTWGNEIRRADSVGESALAQLLSPGQLGNAATTPLDGEITRLYEATGDENVFPRKADWSVTFNGATHKLDNMSYSEFQQVMGQLSFQLADELMESPSYRLMSDEAKAATLSNAYDLAKKVGQAQVFPEYDPDDKLYGIYQSGGADAVIPYLLSDAEIKAARQSKRESTENEDANLNYAELYDSVYGVPGLRADEYAQAYLAHAVNDKAGRLVYHERGADGLETYLQVRTVADVERDGDIGKEDLVATLESAGLTEAQKAYYFGIILPKAKNPYQ